jgi:hypothetical protein
VLDFAPRSRPSLEPVRSPGFPIIQVSRMAPSAALAVQRDPSSSPIPGTGPDNPANLTQANFQRACKRLSVKCGSTKTEIVDRLGRLGYVSRQAIMELGNLFEDEGPQVGPRVAARGRQPVAREPRGLQAKRFVSYLLLLTQGMLLPCTTCTTSQMTDLVSTFVAKTPLRCH